ncbi:MAG TPA: sulfotransferase [Solirubrobacteraceae bacterium]|jgi:hypothetical protein|nr:sulfotransferase [Solirubrobacteraceae bacterium]
MIRANAQVVFTGAAWYSGSTLLGMMLGAHPAIFYAGEANKTRTLNDPSAPLKRRVCRACGPGCAIWDGLGVADGEDLYEALSRRSGRPIVFDSTKEVHWISTQLATLRDAAAVRLVVLTRDGRAVVSSRRRKLDDATPIEELAAFWAHQMRGVEELAATFPGPVHRVRYEELTSRPEQALRALAEFVGVAFDPRMLDPWSSEQHPLGGNDGPLLLLRRATARAAVPGVITADDPTSTWYAAHPVEVVPDQRWRRELSADDLAAFEAVAGGANRAYAWEQPA